MENCSVWRRGGLYAEDAASGFWTSERIERREDQSCIWIASFYASHAEDIIQTCFRALSDPVIDLAV